MRVGNNFLTSILLFVLLSACALASVNSINPFDYGMVKSAIEINNNPHRGTLSINGPEIGRRNKTYFLRTIIEPGEVINDKTFVQIYVQVIFSSWGHLKRAYSEGKRYTLTQIDKSSSCEKDDDGFQECEFFEHVAVNLTLGQIKSEITKRKSFVVEISGIGDAVIVEIPRIYFQAFIDRMENK